MLKLSRILLSALSFSFALLLSIFGFVRLDHFTNPPLIAVSTTVFLMTMAVALVVGKRSRMPAWLAVWSMFVAIGLPIVIHSNHSIELIGDYDTWYVTAVAILLSIVAVRGYQVLAAIGGVSLVIIALYFGGLSFLPVSGLTGALLLIASCIAIAIGLQGATSDIENYQRRTLEQEAQQASLTAARAEHEQKLDELMNSVVPVLKIISSKKKLTKAQRAEIETLDREMRDELTGGNLVTAAMRKAIARARGRGAEVEIVDQGGTRGLSSAELEDLLDIATDAISSAGDGERVHITAPAGEGFVLRLTISRPGVVTPSLDLKLGEGLI